MRMLAGFEEPTSGDILLDGKSVLGVPAHQRPTNLMFQSYALFPHMNVAENIAYGLKQEGLPKAEITARVEEVLTSCAFRISGGAGRINFPAAEAARRARPRHRQAPTGAAARRASGALDRKLREETQLRTRRLAGKARLAFLMVTHDQDEAMTMAHRIGVKQKGRLAQVGTPAEIYEAPETRRSRNSSAISRNSRPQSRSRGRGGDTSLHPTIGTIELDDEGDKPVSGHARGCRPQAREDHARLHFPPHETVNRVGGQSSGISVSRRHDHGAGEAGGWCDCPALASPTAPARSERPIGWDDRVWLSWDIEAPILLDGAS